MRKRTIAVAACVVSAVFLAQSVAIVTFAIKINHIESKVADDSSMARHMDQLRRLADMVKLAERLDSIDDKLDRISTRLSEFQNVPVQR